MVLVGLPSPEVLWVDHLDGIRSLEPAGSTKCSGPGHSLTMVFPGNPSSSAGEGLADAAECV